jgi:hypothetical protein
VQLERGDFERYRGLQADDMDDGRKLVFFIPKEPVSQQEFSSWISTVRRNFGGL